jgi:hypothetical protein
VASDIVRRFPRQLQSVEHRAGCERFLRDGSLEVADRPYCTPVLPVSEDKEGNKHLMRFVWTNECDVREAPSRYYVVQLEVA